MRLRWEAGKPHSKTAYGQETVYYRSGISRGGFCIRRFWFICLSFFCAFFCLEKLHLYHIGRFDIIMLTGATVCQSEERKNDGSG